MIKERCKENYLKKKLMKTFRKDVADSTIVRSKCSGKDYQGKCTNPKYEGRKD